jgi:hypothetical protein
LFALVTATSVQAQMGPATPAPELKKLDFMVGNSTTEGDSKPAPGMPGGKFSWTSHAGWMDGTFFLVEHSDMDMGAMGKEKELPWATIPTARFTPTTHSTAGGRGPRSARNSRFLACLAGLGGSE